MFAGPGDPLLLPDAKKKVELLLEELVVVSEVVSEQGKRFGERTAAGHDLGPPTGDQVECREVLEYTDGVVGAQHRDGARQPDAFGPRGGGSQHDGRSGYDELGAVMLAHPEDVQADLIGELDL